MLRDMKFESLFLSCLIRTERTCEHVLPRVNLNVHVQSGLAHKGLTTVGTLVGLLTGVSPDMSFEVMFPLSLIGTVGALEKRGVHQTQEVRGGEPTVHGIVTGSSSCWREHTSEVSPVTLAQLLSGFSAHRPEVRN